MAFSCARGCFGDVSLIIQNWVVGSGDDDASGTRTRVPVSQQYFLLLVSDYVHFRRELS